MNTNIAWAIVLGSGLGLGVWLLLGALPGFAGPKLASRVAPYVAQFSDGARDFLASHSKARMPFVGTLLVPLSARLRSMVSATLGGSSSIALKLRQAGVRTEVAEFRYRQLLWAAAGATVGLVLVILLVPGRMEAIPAAFAALAVGAGAGFTLKQQLLYRKAKRRLERIAAEMPVVLEFLTLSLSAGEGILDSLRRVSQLGKGELASELGLVVVEVNSGTAVSDALKRLAVELRVPALDRCVDQLLGALERGTPLAEVLRAQAQDAREESKRNLLELAGRKEVAMMIPLVFGVLPVSIIFAVFPGIFVLQLGF